MAEQIFNSPGVYSQESDQSAFSQGQVVRGLAIVGPTEKGAAYVPTDVTTFSQYVALFGTDTSETYVPQTAYSYLQAGQTVKITRVLGNGGWLFNSTKKLAAIVSGSKIISVFHPSKNNNASSAAINETTVAGTYASFSMVISGSQLTTQTLSASMSPTANNYLLKQIGTDQNYKSDRYIH